VSRLLALDVGDRRVGVAVGDTATGVVRPLTTFRRGTLERDAEVVARLATEQRASQLVIGLPLDVRGSEGEQALRTRAWGDELATRTGLATTWRDERLTTVSAEARQPRLRRNRSTGDPTRASIRARRTRVDQDAAVEILRAELAARAASAEPRGG